MNCVVGQDTSLAGALLRLKAAGLSVLEATRVSPSARPACSAYTSHLRPHRRSPDRVTFILVATSADAQALRTAISVAGLAALLKLEPSSFSRHDATDEARPAIDLRARTSPDNNSPRAPVKLADGTHIQPVPNTRQLSAREAEVLRLFAHGALPSQVAQQLYVSPKTVKNHLSHIYAKLGAANRTQAVALAIRQGVVTIG